MSKNSEAVKRWRNKTKARLIEAMGGKCVCCGYHRCNRSMEFHHQDPVKKDMAMGGMRADIVSWKKIVDEAKKCVLVCGNCHGEIHDGMTVVPVDAVGFNPEYEEYRKEKIDETDACPMCGKQKSLHMITCSKACARKKAWSVDWDVIDLSRMFETRTIQETADELGISGGAVRKRMKKLGIIHG